MSAAASEGAAALTVPPDHPALPGHFPGAPIVPGALLLALVLAEMLRNRPGLALASVPMARFLAPVPPGATVTLRWHGEDPVSLIVALEATPVLRATARLASAA